MKLRIASSVVVLAGWMMAMSPARASTLVSMSLDQLTQASSDIVQAQVVNQVSRWNAAHTQILTITTMAVSQVFKGNTDSTVEIQQMGGTIGNMRVFVPGDITFQPLGDYVLFLEPAPESSRYRVVGMTQGAYRVYRDAATHEDRVILPAYSPLQTQIQSISAANPAGTVPLDSFHKYVATLVDAKIQVPHGLALSVAIISTESRGVGRMHVYGRTTTDLFPSKSLVIPAGTEVEGEAVLSSAMWTIHWDELNVRGVHAQISATNQESEGSLRGRSVVLVVR
jgi:hypothetical protein